MARFDKVDSTIGVTRARLLADAAPEDYDIVLGVGLDVEGRAVLKAVSQSGFVGVTIVDRTKRKAGTPIDIMNIGEIVEVAGLVAGKKVYLTAGGLLTQVSAGGIAVGFTIEADRVKVVPAGFAVSA